MIERYHEYVILPDQYPIYDRIENSSVCVIIHLYYEDRVEEYFPYILEIPTDYDIYIISPKETILTTIQNRMCMTSHIRFIIKENRGRDVSALLVSCNEITLNYEYICFLHDKKEKTEEKREHTKEWEKSIWENLVGNNIICRNIIHYLKTHPLVGLLVPPYLATDCQNHNRYADWRNNNDVNTENLLERILGKTIKININECALAIGTVFWARVEALKSILAYPWKYGDFPEEPLPDDGTISHAIERCLPYVVADAGFYTKRIMSTYYAESDVQKKDSYIVDAMDLLQREFGVYSFSFVKSFGEKKKEIAKYCYEKNNIYLYGAGQRGKNAYRFMKNVVGRIPDGFIDQNKRGNTLFSLPILWLTEIEKEDNTGIIVCVGERFIKEIVEYLEENGYLDYKLFVI